MDEASPGPGSTPSVTGLSGRVRHSAKSMLDAHNNNRVGKPGIRATMAMATALIAAALAWPGLRALLHFEPPAAAHLALTLLGVGLAVLAGWALGRRMEPGQQATSAAE